jgi:HK97 family phage portal protein
MLRQLRAVGRSIISGLSSRFRYVSSTELMSDDGDGWFRETDSGELVGNHTAYSYSPWYRAIDLVSSCVAKTTLNLWTQDKFGKWVAAKSHYGYKLLCGHGKPNDETLKYHFIKTLTAHAMGHGGGFAYIMRDRIGQATEILQLRPDRTFPVRENGRLLFVTSLGGDYGASGAETRKLLAENVLHFHGLGWDGLTGYSLMELAARNIGSAVAKERFGARFFRNSATPGVIIKTPRKLSDHAMKHLKDSWQSLRTGITEAHKPIILEDEASAEPFTHNAKDSQLLEAVAYDPVNVANFTGVPPHMLGVKGYQSNSTLESQSQNMLDFTIDPWFFPIEEELNDKLLTQREKDSESHYWQFNRKDLIRVDAEKRASINRTRLGGAPYAMISEVREDEDMDFVEGTDHIPQPLNMGGAAADAENSDPAGDISDLKSEISDLKAQLEAKSKRKRRMVKRTRGANAAPLVDEALREIWQQTVSRMARRLITARTRKPETDVPTLFTEHGETLLEAFAPLCRLSDATYNAAQVTHFLVNEIMTHSETDATTNVLKTVLDHE